jgi:hypothetical protein
LLSRQRARHVLSVHAYTTVAFAREFQQRWQRVASFPFAQNLNVVLDADVSAGEVLPRTMCDGTITNGDVSVSPIDVPVLNNRVEPVCSERKMS